MHIAKILFPTDFSHCSDAGLDFATQLAKHLGATLLIVHIEEAPLAYGGGEMYYGMPEPNTDALRQMLERVKPSDDAVRYEQRLVPGVPATAICDLAAEEHVGLIVMGTHGRTGLSRLLMGSVAEHVMREAPCPVLTYKERNVQPE